MANRSLPTFNTEQRLLDSGFNRIAGIDEAGRGPLAGPVCSAAVILNPKDIPEGINDSKKLSEKKREILYGEIVSRAISVGCSVVSHEAINNTNILAATLASMCNAVSQIQPIPDFLLIDGDKPLSLNIIQDSIVEGDKYCVSIAAASIIAKVTRDRLMMEYDRIYPGYGFAKHKGYGTSFHRQRIKELGPCEIHRFKFKGVKEYV